MAFKLLLTENRSPLGKAIYGGLENHPYVVVCPPTDDFDWHDRAAIADYIDNQHPNLLINTLAHTDADLCTSRLLAEACVNSRVTSIHLSSYQVFGVGSCPEHGYDELDQAQPQEDRGQSLLASETAFQALDRALILRLPWLADARGDNIFTRVSSSLVSGQPLVVSDVWRGCPVTVDEVQRIVVAVIMQIFCGAENWGIFHLHASDSCSEAEFADYIARLLEKEGQTVGPVEVRRDQQSPLMPGCSLLQGTRCMNNFGIQLRSWRLGMKPLVKEWARKEKL